VSFFLQGGSGLGCHLVHGVRDDICMGRRPASPTSPSSETSKNSQPSIFSSGEMDGLSHSMVCLTRWFVSLKLVTGGGGGSHEILSLVCVKSSSLVHAFLFMKSAWVSIHSFY
jgi:hypothetical protein